MKPRNFNTELFSVSFGVIDGERTLTLTHKRLPKKHVFTHPRELLEHLLDNSSAFYRAEMGKIMNKAMEYLLVGP